MITNNRRSSLRGLRTFCVAARHLSFRDAAEELFVTASAVSHQIKSLEQELDLTLFVRHSRTLELTESGETLYRQLEPLLDQVESVIAHSQASAQSRSLRISVQPFFASELFVPRLDEFTQKHPDIEIFIDTSDETAEKHPATADISIRLFRHAPANLSAEKLCPLRLIPACSPEFLQHIDSFDGVDGNAKGQARITQPFTHLLHASRPHVWNAWSRANNITLAKPASLIRLDSMIAVVRAAQKGLGAAMVPVPLVKRWFDQGSLVPMFEEEVVMGESYYLVFDQAKADSSEVQALRDWALETFQGL